jgi:hypothetical protein
MKQHILKVLFLVVNVVNYYWLSLAIGFLYVDITTDIDTFVEKYHYAPEFEMLILVGLIIGPILSIGLSILTFFKMHKIPKRGKYALIGVHTILFIYALVFIFPSLLKN